MRKKQNTPTRFAEKLRIKGKFLFYYSKTSCHSYMLLAARDTSRVKTSRDRLNPILFIGGIS